MTNPFGVDLSQWQSKPKDGLYMDMSKLKGHTEPVSFVFIRASYGMYKDPTHDYYAGELKRLRIPYGSYHYALPSYSSRLQVDHFLSIAPPKEGRRWVLDLEAHQGLSKARITDWTLEFIELMKERTGRYPLIYSRTSWINPYLDVSRLPKLDYWIAQYYSPVAPFTPEFPSDKLWIPKGVAREQVKFHQTGDKGNGAKYGALSHYIDTDRFLGSFEDLREWFGLPDPDPDPDHPVTGVPYRGVIKPVPLYDNAGGEMVASIDTGKEVQVTEKAGDWVRVEQGWLEERWVEQVEKENRLYRASVITDPGYNLLVRVLPHPEGEIVDRLPSGTVVDVLEELEGWLRIGLDRWVMRRWTERVAGDVSWLLPVPYYSQNDPRWRYQKLGTSQTTIGSHGCLVTGVASYMSYLGHAETPLTLNKKLTDNNGYQSGNLYYWNMPRTLYGNVHKTDDRSFGDGTGFEGTLRNILNSRRPALAMVDFIPATSGLDQHWVLMIGYQDNLFYLLDTWDGSVQALHAKYKKIFRLAGYTRR